SEYRPGAQLEQGVAAAGPAAWSAAGHPYPVRRAARALGAVPWWSERHEPQPVHRVRHHGRIDLEGPDEGIDVRRSDPPGRAGRPGYLPTELQRGGPPGRRLHR